jgi:hypothetical protein
MYDGCEYYVDPLLPSLRTHAMITLFVSAAGELCLTLRGADENRILATLRRLPYWQRADIERDPDDPERCLAVTLIADQSHESLVREILQRSFGIRFPAGGGNSEIGPKQPTRPGRRGI